MHRSDQLAAAVRHDDDYTRGVLDGIRRYSYTSSESWAEPGVRYVGTTGQTMDKAFENVLVEQGYFVGLKED